MESPKHEEVVETLLPFKLHFPPKTILGRSKIHINKPLKEVDTITEKFYSKDESGLHISTEVLGKKLQELQVLGPKDKYNKPRTESQRYGWYSEIKFTDSKLHYGIQKKQFIEEHLMNYAKIRNY